MNVATERKPWYVEYQVDVPEGESGSWKVERFEVPESSIERFRCAMQGRDVPPGWYTRLTRNGSVIMSDTPAEVSDHLCAIRAATGRVLIHGLGLGMVLKAVLAKPDVTHVDVVEQSADVLALVAPHYTDPRVTFHHGDAFCYPWPKGAVWDAAWHDVWDNLCTDNLSEMGKLHRRFARRTNWQGSWGRELLKYQQRRERRMGW